jgi:adenosylcobinamide-GDP ribazoletransferase
VNGSESEPEKRSTLQHEPNDPIGQAWRAFKLAAAFLTVIPVRFGDGETTDADLARSRWAYPVVGLLLGLGLGLLSYGLAGRMHSVSTFVLIATWVAITGGLHLDGLADTADGLFLHGNADRRLAVMRDPRVGTFGILAVVLVVLGKYACLSSLATPARSWTVLGAATVGRTVLLVSAGWSRYARPEGTGRFMVEATTSKDALAATLLVFVVSVLAVGPLGFLIGPAVIGLVMMVTRTAEARLGGVTGDTLGAVVELSELLFVLAVAMGR